jgi:hypothetical protein
MFSPHALNEPADFDDLAAAVGVVVPVDDGREGVAAGGVNQPAHETVGEQEIVEDFARGADLEVACGQRGEVGVEFLGGDFAGQFAGDGGAEVGALFAFGLQKFGRAGKDGEGGAVELPVKGFLEAVPEFVARAVGVGEGEEREQGERLGVVHQLGEAADDAGIIEVVALGDAGH